MTKHRNLKAAIRRYAADRAVSYTEARRLMAIDIPEWECTDSESGQHVTADLQGNILWVSWLDADGSKKYRFTSTHQLLKTGSWPTPNLKYSHNKPLIVNGALQGEEGGELVPVLTSKMTEWVCSQVENPLLLDKGEEKILADARQPMDVLITLIERETRQAVIHVFRMPDEVLPDGDAATILKARGNRLLAADREAWDALPQDQREDIEKSYPVNHWSRAGLTLEEIITQEQAHLADPDQVYHQQGLPDFDTLRWSTIEYPDTITRFDASAKVR